MNPATTTAVILAGGLGTRLQTVMPDVPKPMAPVRGRPFLEYLVGWLRDSGIHHIVMCVGFKAECIESHFSTGEKFGVEIQYALEKELRGTAGAILNAQPLVRSDSFLALNGDTFCPVDLRALCLQHADREAVATLVVSKVTDASRFGTVAFSDDRNITSFQEKGTATAGYVNAGVYALNWQAFAAVSALKVSSIEYDVFHKLVDRGLYAFPVDLPFYDIGTPESFAQAETVSFGANQ